MADETGASPEILVVGGGQSGLAVGYFLRRLNRPFAILDAEPAPGGAWRHGWESLRLFSPAEASSLPGWKLPPAGEGGYPGRDHVIDYLARYEARYGLPVERPMRVSGLRRGRDGGLVLETDRGERRAPAVVAATGTWSAPYVPDIPGRRGFRGLQVHSARYRDPQPFAGKQVLVVGGGNSGAQILAEVAPVAAEAIWVTLAPPTFLPDEVDGRVLFTEANRRFHEGAADTGYSLGDIVAVPSVRAARAAGRLASVRPFRRFTPDGAGVEWADGTATPVDAVIWCTGFRPATGLLAPLGIVDAEGRVATDGTRAVEVPGLWLAGYGSWTGFASATLFGITRSARTTAQEIGAWLALPPAARTAAAWRRLEAAA